MRYLVLSDIHGNLEALEAVLANAGPFDAVLSLGDLVGYGPNPNEVVDRVRELPTVTGLVGNHDLAALGLVDRALFNDLARAAAEWTGEVLRDDVRAYLESLPSRLDTEEFTLAHASPRDPIWEYLEYESQGPSNFRSFNAPLAFVGHTHIPRVFTELDAGRSQVTSPGNGERLQLVNGQRHIVNPGGVGQPRNGDARAAYGIFDSSTGELTFHRTAYPFPTTQAKIRQAGLPQMLAERLAFGY